MEYGGLECLRELVAKLRWNVNFPALVTDEVKQKYKEDPIECMLALTRQMGWRPRRAAGDPDQLREQSGPAMVQFRSGRWVCAVDIAQMQRDNMALIDPKAAMKQLTMPAEEFARAISGDVLIFENLQEIDPRKQTALYALVRIAQHHQTALDIRRLMHDYAIGEEEPGIREFLSIIRDCDFKCRRLHLEWEKLPKMGEAYPFIGFDREGKAFICCGTKKTETGFELVVVDVLDRKESSSQFSFWSKEDFDQYASGNFVLLKKHYALTDEEQPFSLRWFLPEFLKLRGVFGQIILLVISLTVVSFLTPLFFQIVVDKVLVHRGFNTLNVLGAGIVIAIVFNGIMEFMRNYLLLFATNKIDINTATKTFRHLMHLPIDFFEKVPSGVLLKHMQQTEKIRGFLSGNLFFTVLDLFSLLLFLPVLALYSLPLTAIVLGFSLLMALVVAALIKPFQRRLNDLYQAEGKRQSMLVESIHGIRTVKSLALEPVEEKAWDNTTACAINSYFRVGKISITARSISQTLEMLMMIAVIWIGALLVFHDSLSIGALIAFQMLAGRVTSPLVRLVGLIHEYQQIALSVRMLGVVMNTRCEPQGHGVRQQLKGNIAFENVSFQYSPDRPNIIRDFSLEVPAGSIVGIVGRSGSGKTTLTKLLQGLYHTQRGLIKIDGIDIREIDKAHLRCSIGVVLQENYFFSGTVRDNISLTKRHATIDEVIYAAQLAGAHDFVSALPQGYDTVLEENASNLSGGQKQRLAIARALLTNPPILIFDEATSSLDPESEAVIQNNLRQISRGRTVLIVSHRLSIVSGADRILVLDNGVKTAFGTHQDLLARPGTYRDFWHQQMERGMAR